jgi:hypothetical protein
MSVHRKNLQKIKKLTSELSECMTSTNSVNYPSFYTAEEDPEVDFIVDRRWILLGENRKYPVLKKGRYSELPYDCKMIVDDIVSSSQLEMFKQWDTNFRRKYYTRAILMAYELCKEDNKNIFTMIRGWFYSITKFRTRCL